MCTTCAPGDQEKSTLSQFDAVAVGMLALLAADADQGWSVAQALEMLPRLVVFDRRWREESIRADRPRANWRRLREAASMPIAAGENISSLEDFTKVLTDDVLGVVQHDVAK